ncbi:MAG: hypothetical protein QM775_28715 [Pirellulales bacterium]
MLRTPPEGGRGETLIRRRHQHSGSPRNRPCRAAAAHCVANDHDDRRHVDDIFRRRRGRTASGVRHSDKIECRDVTPPACAAAHPDHKVIEAQFRISAGFLEGSEDSIVDFTYMISSPKLRLKIRDYLPNTTLESQYADDRIEVADYTESARTSTAEALVGYSIFSLNAVTNSLQRRTEHNQYEKIAPKALVLASGTMNRGHGVFYKLRPSKGASLEGAKEFAFLAVVPRSWRGDWCTFVCSARANRRTLLGSQVVGAGVTKVDVGLHLCGDQEAGDLAARLCLLQQENDGMLAKHSAREAEAAMAEIPSGVENVPVIGKVDEFFHLVAHKASTKPNDPRLAEAQTALHDVEERLGRLSGAAPLTASADPREGDRQETR